MSYHTSFEGNFVLNRPLTVAEANVLNAFADARHDPETGLPGYYCDWVPTEDGTGIEVRESDTFYAYTDWLRVIIDHFLKPWGLVLNGQVEWDGEEKGDRGLIVVADNVVAVKKAKIVYD